MAKVLVLDDVFDAVNLIKRILELAGHDVAGFTEEEDALDFVKRNPVDLAILLTDPTIRWTQWTWRTSWWTRGARKTMRQNLLMEWLRKKMQTPYSS